MHKNWAFDQFVEYTAAGVDIDQVASSGKDQGSTKFKINPNVVRLKFARTLINSSYQLKPIKPYLPSLEVDGPTLHVSNALSDFYVKLSSQFSSNNGNTPLGFKISNGKISTQYKLNLKNLNKCTKQLRILISCHYLVY